eukprot:m.17730 g.17730  ORF g.17730 m.17730 type:complete len:395 (+) comp7980_c0_seq1:42-1226(+)
MISLQQQFYKNLLPHACKYLHLKMNMKAKLNFTDLRRDLSLFGVVPCGESVDDYKPDRSDAKKPNLNPNLRQRAVVSVHGDADGIEESKSAAYVLVQLIDSEGVDVLSYGKEAGNDSKDLSVKNAVADAKAESGHIGDPGCFEKVRLRLVAVHEQRRQVHSDPICHGAKDQGRGVAHFIRERADDRAADDLAHARKHQDDADGLRWQQLGELAAPKGQLEAGKDHDTSEHEKLVCEYGPQDCDDFLQNWLARLCSGAKAAASRLAQGPEEEEEHGADSADRQKADKERCFSDVLEEEVRREIAQDVGHLKDGPEDANVGAVLGRVRAHAQEVHSGDPDDGGAETNNDGGRQHNSRDNLDHRRKVDQVADRAQDDRALLAEKGHHRGGDEDGEAH